MRVSVVIPSYNSAAFVGEAIASTLAQSSPPYEVIVVDDGSTDDTQAVLAEFGDRIQVIRQPNGGVSVARNVGVAAASGDWIGFLDADDVWHPQKLAIQQAALQRGPKLVLIASGIYDWPVNEHPAVDENAAGCVVPFDSLVVRNQIVTSTVLVRTQVMRWAGDFDSALRGPEDYDQWLRVARLGPVAVLDTRLTGYRTVAGSLSRHAANMDAGMRRILVKLAAEGAFAGKPALQRRAWGYYRYSAGYMHLAGGNRRTAVGHLLLSLLSYPLPYPRRDMRSPFARIRLLLAAGRGGEQ